MDIALLYPNSPDDDKISIINYANNQKEPRKSEIMSALKPYLEYESQVVSA